jgi:hydrogenase maturation factor
MCDSTLHEVLEVLDGGRVLGRDLEGVTHQVSLLAFDGETPAIGTWLVVHSGYAIDRVEEHDAQLALEELQRANAIDAAGAEMGSSERSDHR